MYNHIFKADYLLFNARCSVETVAFIELAIVTVVAIALFVALVVAIRKNRQQKKHISACR